MTKRISNDFFFLNKKIFLNILSSGSNSYTNTQPQAQPGPALMFRKERAYVTDNKSDCEDGASSRQKNTNHSDATICVIEKERTQEMFE